MHTVIVVIFQVVYDAGDYSVVATTTIAGAMTLFMVIGGGQKVVNAVSDKESFV